MRTALLIALMLGALCRPAAAGPPPAIYPQLTQLGAASSVAVSPNGKLLATGAQDQTVDLWDIASGRQMRILAVGGNHVETVVFSPEGSTLAAASDSGDVGLWTSDGAQQLHRIAAGPGESGAVAFSPDGKTIATGGQDGMIRLWDVASARPSGLINGGAGVISSLAFAPDGRSLASAAYQGVSVLDVATGKALHHLVAEARVTSAAYAPDGKSVLTGAADGAVELWDLQSEKPVRDFVDGTPTQQGEDVNIEVGFSPKGDLVAAASVGGPIKIWAAPSAGFMHALPTASAGSFAFFPNDDGLAAADLRFGAQMWDARGGGLVRIFTGSSGPVSSVAFLPTPGTVLAATAGYAIGLWDAVSGHKLRSLAGSSQGEGPFAVSPDGKLLAAQDGNAVKVWDMASGQVVHTLAWTGDAAPQAAFVESVAFSPQQDRIAAGADDGSIFVWELAMDRQVATISGTDGYTNPIAFSPDGSTLAAASALPNTSAVLWDTRSWRQKRSLPGPSGAVLALSFSPDGKAIATGGKDGLVKVWDAASGVALHAFAADADAVDSVAFSPDGGGLLSAGDDMQATLWDLATGAPRRVFKGSSGRINAAAFAPGGKLLATGGVDGATRVWDAGSGRQLASLMAFDDGSWIAVTPEGFFDSSSELAEETLNVRIGDRVFGMSSFRDTFYRPDLVRRSLSGEDISRYGDIAGVKLSPEVEFVDLPATSADPTVKVTVKLTDGGGGIGPVRLFKQGTVILQDDGNSGATRRYAVPLSSGDNHLRVAAANADGSMWSDIDGQVTLTAPANVSPAVGVLHAIVVGIDDFPKSPSNDLKYAVSDANLFADTLNARAAPLFKSLDIQRLTTAEATDRTHLLKVIKAMQASVAPDDAFVFYAASHGVVSGGEYYFITSNVSSVAPDRLKADAISRRELTDLLANIRTTRKVVFIDTCEAGGLADVGQQAVSTQGMDPKTAATLISRQIGMTLSMAATTDQEALEGYQNHGLFTYALADGLSGKASDPQTGAVTSLDLARYVDAAVPILAKTLNSAQQPIDSEAGRPFPLTQVK